MQNKITRCLANSRFRRLSHIRQPRNNNRRQILFLRPARVAPYVGMRLFSTRVHSSSAHLSDSMHSASCDGNVVKIKGLFNHQDVAFTKEYLRDHCPCPKCIHETTRQKIYSSGASVVSRAIIDHIHMQNDGLHIFWACDVNKGDHQGFYDLNWLVQHSSPSNVFQKNINHIFKPFHWDESILPLNDLWFDYADYMRRDESLLDLLSNLSVYGLAFLQNVEHSSKSVVNIAERIGSIRETFYGRTWDVTSTAAAKNAAYTNAFLDLHMDLLYVTLMHNR